MRSTYATRRHSTRRLRHQHGEAGRRNYQRILARRNRVLFLEQLEPRLVLDGAFWLSSLSVLGVASAPFDKLELTFSQEVDEATFQASDVVLTGAGGDLVPQTIPRLAENRYEVDFGGTTSLLDYTLVVGPDIESELKQLMDQNRDGTTGDPYQASLLAGDVAIANEDPTYDGKALFLYGNTAVIDGPHVFPSLSVLGGTILTHSAATTTDKFRLELDIADDLLIDASSRIDAYGRGYLPGYTVGNTTEGGATQHAGGGYGGLGYTSTEVSHQVWVYGDFRNPNKPGSGGANPAPSTSRMRTLTSPGCCLSARSSTTR